MSIQNRPQPNEAVNANDQLDLSGLSPEASEALKQLDPQQREIIIQSIRNVKQESFSGPIPHPDLLQGYENVKQDFAERIHLRFGVVSAIR